jgi:hypothetical protein
MRIEWVNLWSKIGGNCSGVKFRAGTTYNPVAEKDSEVESGELSACICRMLPFGVNDGATPGVQQWLRGAHRPLVAFGETSACKTGAVELMQPAKYPFIGLFSSSIGSRET